MLVAEVSFRKDTDLYNKHISDWLSDFTAHRVRELIKRIIALHKLFATHEKIMNRTDILHITIGGTPSSPQLEISSPVIRMISLNSEWETLLQATGMSIMNDYERIQPQQLVLALA
ncbi:hypothetical protein GJ688_15525 [Heliobacillus mobilis]|uniref:Uncharacterized protein n=2 Tax=Heliobacterium TaxID=2697 RepID=A0A6I3SNA2_HELMO|nr:MULTISPECIES: hypothetical protein [Heliobacterium]MBC9786725.1 hypothetical protein [Heliobacterium chlorum]MTV50379.1 hypothetical protein [Heliobacterium mobile]